MPGITTGVKGDYAANGVRETSNNFTLDGTDNSDVWQSIGSRNPPPDALQEFTVQSNYSAEYGRGGGVAIHALTKSGTNAFHGSVYDYFRSENLNANTFERNAEGLSKPDFKQHQWGGTIGGPIAIPGVYDGRNKSFFFFNMQRLGTPAAPYLVRRGGLTAAELAGDFSQSAEFRWSRVGGGGRQFPLCRNGGPAAHRPDPLHQPHRTGLVQAVRFSDCERERRLCLREPRGQRASA